MEPDRKIAGKYLVFTFLLSYLAWGSIVAANHFGYLQYGTPVSMVLFLIGGNAPPIVSYVLCRRSGIFIGFKSFLQTIFSFKQSLAHYALVIGFVALYFGVPAIMASVHAGSPFYLSVLLIPLMVFAGGLEEVGWRYVLQPALEQRLPFVLATAINACIWTVWHLPLFFINGTSQFGTSFLVFGISVFGLAFSLAAIYSVSKNIWLCILLHSMINAFYESFVIEDSTLPMGVAAGLMILVSVGIVYLNKKARIKNSRNKDMTRK